MFPRVRSSHSPTMSVVAFSFGSFGDIATVAASVLQAPRKLQFALADLRAASSEIRALSNDLDAFANVLAHIDRTLRGPEASAMPDGLRNAIEHALRLCCATLARMQTRIDTQRERITKTLGHSVWKQYWAACPWSIMGGHQAVSKLKEQLSAQLQAIQILLALSQSNQAGVISQDYQRIAEILDIIRRNVGLIQRQIMFNVPFSFFDRNGAPVQPSAPAGLEEFSRVLGDVDGFAPGRHLSSQFEAAEAFWRANDPKGALRKIMLPSTLRAQFRSAFIRGIEWEGVEVPLELSSAVQPSHMGPSLDPRVEDSEVAPRFELELFFYRDPHANTTVVLPSPVFLANRATSRVAVGATEAMVSLIESRRRAAAGRPSHRDYIRLRDFRDAIVKEIVGDIASDVADSQRLLAFMEKWVFANTVDQSSQNLGARY